MYTGSFIDHYFIFVIFKVNFFKNLEDFFYNISDARRISKAAVLLLLMNAPSPAPPRAVNKDELFTFYLVFFINFYKLKKQKSKKLKQLCLCFRILTS